MITFEVIDQMPSKAPASEPHRRRVVIHGNGAYKGGYIRCYCGAESPESLDPLGPFRWLGRHVHAEQ